MLQDAVKAKMLADQDVELELWESLKLLEAVLDRLREEQKWVKVGAASASKPRGGSVVLWLSAKRRIEVLDRLREEQKWVKVGAAASKPIVLAKLSGSTRAQCNIHCEPRAA